MKNLKYVAKIEASSDILEDEINTFINSMLLESEYIIDVRIVKIGEYEYPGYEYDSRSKEYQLIALLYIGEDKDEME